MYTVDNNQLTNYLKPKLNSANVFILKRTICKHNTFKKINYFIQLKNYLL